MSAATDPNDTIYQDKGGNPRPRAIYLYYFRDDNNDHNKVYFVERDYKITNLQREVESIIDEIENNERKPIHTGVGKVYWTRPSFVVFVLKGEKFVPKGAASFVQYETGRNHSFFYGKDLKNYKDYSIAACINVRINK